MTVASWECNVQLMRYNETNWFITRVVWLIVSFSTGLDDCCRCCCCCKWLWVCPVHQQFNAHPTGTCVLCVLCLYDFWTWYDSTGHEQLYNSADATNSYFLLSSLSLTHSLFSIASSFLFQNYWHFFSLVAFAAYGQWKRNWTEQLFLHFFFCSALLCIHWMRRTMDPTFSLHNFFF